MNPAPAPKLPTSGVRNRVGGQDVLTQVARARFELAASEPCRVATGSAGAWPAYGRNRPNEYAMAAKVIESERRVKGPPKSLKIQ